VETLEVVTKEADVPSCTACTSTAGRGSGEEWERDTASEARKVPFQALRGTFFCESNTDTLYEAHAHKAASVFILVRPVPLRNVCTIYMSYKL